MRQEFRRRLNQIPGVSIPDDAKALEAFKDVLDWFCQTVRSHVD